jgi:hypothetical protein
MALKICTAQGHSAVRQQARHIGEFSRRVRDGRLGAWQSGRLSIRSATNFELTGNFKPLLTRSIVRRLASIVFGGMASVAGAKIGFT